MQKTIIVDGEKIVVRVTRRTWAKHFLGWYVDINGKRYKPRVNPMTPDAATAVQQCYMKWVKSKSAQLMAATYSLQQACRESET